MDYSKDFYRLDEEVASSVYLHPVFFDLLKSEKLLCEDSGWISARITYFHHSNNSSYSNFIALVVLLD